MYQIQPEFAAKGYFKIRKLPIFGYLTKNGVPLQVGSKFTQADIMAGKILYHNTVTIESGNDEAEDSFEFSLWDPELGDITLSSYHLCMPPREVETPEDGIFVFPITIVKPTVPEATVTGEPLTLREEGRLLIDKFVLSVTDAQYEPDQIIHTVTNTLENGYISLRGRSANMFTQADIDQEDVVYVNTKLGNGIERLEVTTCNIKARCVNSALEFTIAPKFRQTGDNVIYAEIGSIFNWTFSTNATEALWELKDGTEEPPLSAMPFADYIVDWSTYAVNSDLPVGSPDRGPGYDKLPSYRNIKEKLYWEGGLPLGTTLSSVGYFGTTERTPASQAGTQPWFLPYHPGRYPFTAIAYNPKTGETHTRRYVLVLTSSGLSNDGLASESVDL